MAKGSWVSISWRQPTLPAGCLKACVDVFGPCAATHALICIDLRLPLLRLHPCHRIQGRGGCEKTKKKKKRLCWADLVEDSVVTGQSAGRIAIGEQTRQKTRCRESNAAGP
jgi:hypothetical protein